MPRIDRKNKRLGRRTRIRRKVSGTSEIPRMAVFTSDQHVYVQFIDDVAGRTLASCSTRVQALRSQDVRGNIEGAAAVGKLAGERALEAGIRKVVFDRGGFQYHGRIAAVASAAREAGLEL